MKNTVFKIQPRIILYAVVAISVLFLLALSYILSTQPKPNSATQIFGNDAKNIPSTLSENQDGQTESTNSSTSTKVNVSINQSTTNGETSGQATVKVTENGKTTIFEEAINGSRISINVDDEGDIDIEQDGGKLEVNFNTDWEQDSKTEIESSSDIDYKSRIR